MSLKIKNQETFDKICENFSNPDNLAKNSTVKHKDRADMAKLTKIQLFLKECSSITYFSNERLYDRLRGNLFEINRLWCDGNGIVPENEITINSYKKAFEYNNTLAPKEEERIEVYDVTSKFIDILPQEDDKEKGDKKEPNEGKKKLQCFLDNSDFIKDFVKRRNAKLTPVDKDRNK